MIITHNNFKLRTLHVNSFTLHTGTFTRSGNEITCTGNGYISIPQKFAYGTWEFNFYKGNTVNSMSVSIISERNDIPVTPGTTAGTYRMALANTEAITLYRDFNSINVGGTAIDYFLNQTTYRIKVTRTKSRLFSAYIKGGTFTDWTSLFTPATNTTYTTCNYFLASFVTGDKISDITFKPYI